MVEFPQAIKWSHKNIFQHSIFECNTQKVYHAVKWNNIKKNDNLLWLYIDFLKNWLTNKFLRYLISAWIKFSMYVCKYACIKLQTLCVSSVRFCTHADVCLMWAGVNLHHCLAGSRLWAAETFWLLCRSPEAASSPPPEPHTSPATWRRKQSIASLR